MGRSLRSGGGGAPRDYEHEFQQILIKSTSFPRFSCSPVTWGGGEGVYLWIGHFGLGEAGRPGIKNMNSSKY
jgi:hypothetical protein